MEFKIINPDVIRQSMMNRDDMIQQFVELYIFQCPLDFEALTTAINKNDPYAIKAAAHHIKPTMEYIGASALRTSFQELEEIVYLHVHQSEIENKYQDIKLKFDQMLYELAVFNAKIKGG